MDRKERVKELIEPWFMFSLVWTVGATTDNDGRKKFDKFIREQSKTLGVSFSPWSYPGPIIILKLTLALEIMMHS